MFDANLRYLRPGRLCLIHVMSLSQKSPLYQAGFRKDDHVVGRVVETLMDGDDEEADEVELQLSGLWHSASRNTAAADEWLVFEEMMPTAVEPLRANDPRERITRL